ncbi:hypothetical protein Poli38472_002922 [Pythium oligandrum]|uniref:Uncharacterized protein n=1 Tax=Pythium oligandrum TaxID=41045 RepID=A0A8K1C6M0_PYTOL|nr:hypothetical protein Poli38472_002922 [Pythium oligandrum]|eukprot:TMW56997.1 hypothetical protein Poli38472_002922 [Pythium oligandrum]
METTEGPTASGWHRKWLWLVVVLAWIYLSRFRLLGWLLSQGLRLGLRLTQSRLRIDVQIQYVLFRPLQFVKVEFRCADEWRVSFSRITIQSHFRAFLRSFGQRKMIVLTINDLHIDVHHVNEELLREVLLASASKKPTVSTAPTAKPHSKSSSLGYMRFVDVCMGNLRVNLDCFQVHSHFGCSDLKVGITDVLLDENILHLQVEMSSMHFSSRRSGGSELLSAPDEDIHGDFPHVRAVTDVRLTDQDVVGCKLDTNQGDEALLHVSTAFVEYLLVKRAELIRKDLFPIPKSLMACEDGAKPKLFAVRVIEFPLRMVLLHCTPSRIVVPLQFSMHIVDLRNEKSTQGVPADRTPDPATRTTMSGIDQILVDMNIRDLVVRTGVAFKQDVLAMSSVEVHMIQRRPGKGTIAVNTGGMDVALNPAVCEVLHSLVVFPDLVDKYDYEALDLMREKVAERTGRPSTRSGRKGPLEWEANVDIESWKLRIWLQQMELEKENLRASGQHTSLSSRLPPKSSGLAVTHSVAVDEVNLYLPLPSRSSEVDHEEGYCAHFEGAEVWTSKQVAVKDNAKVMEVKTKFAEVIVNELHKDSDDPPRKLPAGCVSGVSIQLREVELQGAVETNLQVDFSDTCVIWDHRKHRKHLRELDTTLKTIDEARIMLTPPGPETTDADKATRLEKSKVMKTAVSVSNASVRLVDVVEVAPTVDFLITDCKVAYQKSTDSVSNLVNCAFVKLLWGNGLPVMEVVGTRFEQAVDLVKQREGVVSDASASISVTLSELRLWMRPTQRLLLLILRLDELVNEKEAENLSLASKRPSKQEISMMCSKVEIDVSNGTVAVDEDKPFELCLQVLMDTLHLRTTMTKSFSITDAIIRYLQTTRRDEACRSCLVDTLRQALGIEGLLSVGAVKLSIPRQPVVSVVEFETRFALTDVARRTKRRNSSPGTTPTRSLLPVRFLIFDASVWAKQWETTIETRGIAALQAALPIIHETFNTKEENASDATEVPSPHEWRLRYVGSMDFGVDSLLVSIPYGSQASPSGSFGTLTSGDAGKQYVVAIAVSHLALNCRQIQKIVMNVDSLHVNLTDEDSFIGRSERDKELPSLQLLSLPQSKMEVVIHWQDDLVRDEGAPVDSGRFVQHFGVSFELVVRGKNVSASNLVPANGEVLLALDWDHVYPLLVFMLTEEDEEDHVDEVEEEDERDLVFKCIGVQWNVSLDTLQVAWWDTLTQDAGVLLLANDLLSHGVTRFLTCVPPNMPVAATEEFPKWVLWETTVYLDLLRGYLLREASTTDDVTYGHLPFEPILSSRFFVELMGTSYRASYLSMRADTNEDSPPDGIFGDLGFAVADNMHEGFAPVHYGYCIGTTSRLHRMASMSSLTIQIPPAISAQTAAAVLSPSPPKSPKAWTQAVRTKLARLKRRTSSMDNLLLNDGSCPIQVDSMKLLWTLETRDSAFYMIAVISDSLNVIVEAKEVQQKAGSTDRSSIISVDGKLDGTRSASLPGDGSQGPSKSDLFRSNRRGSTRDTLLDLLHQGKLGKKHSASPEIDPPRHLPADDEESFGRMPRSEEFALPTVMSVKKYTLDVHDAQINMFDEASRSSALVASKHIHLDVGFDDTYTTTIANLKFDCVTAHVAPVDVDVSAGVLWYSHSKVASSQIPSPRGTSSPLLLKQVMDECSLTLTYSETIASGATAVNVDLSSLQLSTDRHQFYQLLDVLRHVLLAPPTVIRRTKKAAPTRAFSTESSTQSLDEMDISVFPASPSISLQGQSTKRLHAQVEEELRLRDVKSLNASRTEQVVVKLITARAEGCVFRLGTSPETTGGDHEFVEIRVEGITGSHSHYLSQSTKLTLNLQWMEINNLRPGPSSIAFKDPTAVLKAKLLVNHRFQTSKRIQLGNQKGMLSIRAESGPQMRVLGQKLRVLEMLEISVFPEIQNMIVIQLAADFYELIHKFFFEHLNPTDQTVNSEQVFFGRRTANSTIGPGSTTPSSSTASGFHPLSPLSKSRVHLTPGSPTHASGVVVKRKSTHSSTHSSSSWSEPPGSPMMSPTSSAITASFVEAAGDEDETPVDGHELFYFKYVRIGNIRLRINCNGFFVNLSNFDLDLAPFVCQSKLGTWKKLVQKFENHLKWVVAKKTTSSGLSHFKNKLLKWDSHSSDKKDKHKKHEDTATSNAQVLFGPYSGAPSGQ